MALILQHLTEKSFWADHWSAVRSSDDNIRDDGEDLVNHGRRLVGSHQSSAVVFCDRFSSTLAFPAEKWYNRSNKYFQGGRLCKHIR